MLVDSPMQSVNTEIPNKKDKIVTWYGIYHFFQFGLLFYVKINVYRVYIY